MLPLMLRADKLLMRGTKLQCELETRQAFAFNRHIGLKRGVAKQEGPAMASLASGSTRRVTMQRILLIHSVTTSNWYIGTRFGFRR